VSERALFTVSGTGSRKALAALVLAMPGAIECQSVRFGVLRAVVIGAPAALLDDLDGRAVAGLTLTRRREVNVLTRQQAVDAHRRLTR
jgi:hypothetical protein